MNKKQVAKVVMTSVIALGVFSGVASAMEPVSGDAMMKKDDAMMKDSAMKKDETMMKKEGVMMKDDAVTSSGADLFMGSRGEQVTALQSFLESKGYLTMPAGVSKGYFGTLTKMALMKYQESSGVRATGYYGPITRGAMSKAMMKDTAGTMKKDGEMMDKKMQ